MTSQETVPRRLGCPDSPAKAWQNCKKPDLRGKCLSPSFLIFVSGNGAVSPPVLQSYSSPGLRGPGERGKSSILLCTQLLPRGRWSTAEVQEFLSISAAFPALSSLALPVSHHGDVISSQPAPHCGFLVSSFLPGVD